MELFAPGGVPYALKAADADTLVALPSLAYVPEWISRDDIADRQLYPLLGFRGWVHFGVVSETWPLFYGC